MGPVVPTPPPGNSVGVIVFHDDNADGVLQATEGSRIPEVRITISGRTAATEPATGRATVSGVPAGSQSLAIDPASLPPFFQAPASPPQFTVPTDADVYVPLVLPIGDNQPRTYLTYGDSITLGIGSTDGTGYRSRLQAKLRAHFGDAIFHNEARDANATERGLRLINGTLEFVRPAYIIIMLGTNDWQEAQCQNDVALCPIVPNLRGMVRRTKDHRTLPVIATLPPTNPAINEDRNRWNEAINAQIKTMAAEEGGVLVADVYAAMRARSDLPSLYDNDVHPNDAGYDVIAEALFQAIAHGRVE